MARARPTVEVDTRKIDAIFAKLNQSCLPGAAVGIGLKGRPIYRKGFGLANIELPVVLSRTIRMRIFSVSKHFTCLAYMLLCEEGRASLDDRVERYLPELHPVCHRVTMRQLMGNTGGLRDVFDISWQLSGTGWSVSSQDLLALYRDFDDVNSAPGTAWIYNNGGFLILTAVIERITGRPLEEVLGETVFEPTGMVSTLLRRFDSDFVPNSATLHMTNSAGHFQKSYIGEAIAGEGGIVSTIDDMLRWLAHMDSPVVGTPATWEVMKSPQRLVNGTATGYGLGLFTDHYRGVETLYHAGGAMGGSSQMIKVPEAGMDVVVITNREDARATEFAEKILDCCLIGLEPVRNALTVPPAFGVFRSSRTGRVLQLFACDGKQVASLDGMDMPVESDGGHLLWPTGTFRNVKTQLTLIGDLQNPTQVQVSDCGTVDTLVRTSLVTKDCANAIYGQYRSESTGTIATVSPTPEEPSLVSYGRFGSATYRLECLAEGIWRAKSKRAPWLGGILSFDAKGDAFSFATYRTLGLHFRRKE